MNHIPDSLILTKITTFQNMKSLFLSLALTPILHAQAPGVGIFDQSRGGQRNEQNAISDQAKALFEKRVMLTLEKTIALVDRPIPQSLNLPNPKTKEATPAQVAKMAKASGYRVGWAYLCNSCDNWHVNLAGGYAVTNDGVIATCAHVVETDRKKMRDGSLIAVDSEGKVHPITSILSIDKKIDGALLKIDAKTVALPFNDQVAPGDPAFCLSRPLKQGQYFSKGIVNRFYWNSDNRGDDPNSLESLRALKLNVSTRWAPGSSGSAVLDGYGNVIGHVATISTMGNRGTRKDTDKSGRTLITLHTATPARAMKALAKIKPAFKKEDGKKATVQEYD